MPATVAVLDGLMGGHRGRSKLADGECHGTEKFAWVGRVIFDTFFVGDDKFGGLDEILSRTNEAYQRENTQGYNKDTLPISIAVANRGGEASGYTCGDVSCTATTANRFGDVRFKHFDPQHDRLYDFYHGCGNDVFFVARLRLGTKSRAVAAAAENADIALTAPKHDLLFKHSDAVKFLALAGANATLEDDFDVKTDGDGVKTTVELDGVDADIRPSDRGIFGSDLGGMVDDILTYVGEEYFDIFKAISVTARVEHTMCFDADSVFLRLSARVWMGGILQIEWESVFTHDINLLEGLAKENFAQYRI